MFYTCSVVSDCDPWTVARQALLSMGFFRQEYWSGLPIPPQGDLPNSGIKTASPVSPALYRWILDLLSHRGSPYIYMCVCVCVCVYVCVCVFIRTYIYYILYIISIQI